ncbi:MAG: hypothetical protein JWO09_918 [Bacteroidetes bacterium]|nr:hypothetical protein [Bacteroidota bacterium]
MKKKNVLFIAGAALLLSVGFAACKKENSVTPANPETAGATFQQKDLVNDFGYTLYTVTNNDGSKDFKCLRPKTDCTKIRSAKTAERDKEEELLDEAIANSSIASFFATTSGWDDLMPNLTDQKDWLDFLTSGNFQLVKKTDLNDGGILYIAIPASVSPNTFTENDVKFAIGITDED